MNRCDLLEALAAAEAEFARRDRWGFGPDGFGPLPPEEPRQCDPRPLKSRWTGRPRKNSKQGRRERGGIV